MRLHGLLYTSDILSQLTQKQAQLYQLTYFKVSFSYAARWWLLLLFHYTPRFWRTTWQPPKTVQSRDPTNLCPFWAIHQTFTQSSPAEATSIATLGSWSSSIPSHPARQQRTRAARGLRKGKFRQCLFLKPCIQIYSQQECQYDCSGSKYPSTAQSSRNSLHIYYMWLCKATIHHESTEEVIKHRCYGIICFHLSSVSIKHIRMNSVNTSTVTLQCSSPFS